MGDRNMKIELYGSMSLAKTERREKHKRTRRSSDPASFCKGGDSETVLVVNVQIYHVLCLPIECQDRGVKLLGNLRLPRDGIESRN
jgi:hypothetical protein